MTTTKTAAVNSLRAGALAYMAAREPAALVLTPAEKALVAALLNLGVANLGAVTATTEAYDLRCALTDLFARLGAPLDPSETNGAVLAAMHRVRDEDWFPRSAG